VTAHDPLAVVTVARVGGQVWAATPCGCVVRLNQPMEQTGQVITQMLQHAEEVATGERGGCLLAPDGAR
jgi:hypothetical protein